MCELCDRYGISRKTGYKWLQYYLQEGVAGLEDHPRRPQHSPTATPAPIREAVLAVRRAHPTWGGRKLEAWLARREPGTDWPAVSTISKLLHQAGMVGPRPRPLRPARPASDRVVPTQPNAVWATDFKGEFLTGDHRYCYPLTVMDGFSRYLLLCHGMGRMTVAETQRCFEQVFRRYGLPEVIRSDNGTPFASPAVGGLSRLSVWWIQLGITLDHIRPGHPEENGSLERFHRTLKAETARPPASTGRMQQGRFDGFKREYNEERPHEALNFAVPAERYQPSPRPYPRRLPRPEYLGHWPVRRIDANGVFGWRGRHVFLTTVVAGQDIAFDEVGDGVWTLFFYHTPIGRFDERTGRVFETGERPRVAGPPAPVPGQ
jgi:transposase InsO family protein